MTQEIQTSIEVIDHKPQQLARATIFSMEPEAQIEYAAKIATALTNVIEKQKLYTVIQGKKYVRVEAWELLGTFLGVLPRERHVIELPDGSYEAAVDLLRAIDGVVIGGSSAICGIDEKRWSNADKYARRSMAITRAVGKSYRTSFSWIISLAGYQVTPAEEMPIKDESYNETPEQKKILANYAKDCGVTAKEELIELSKSLRGVPMASLQKEAKAFIEIPFKS